MPDRDSFERQERNVLSHRRRGLNVEIAGPRPDASAPVERQITEEAAVTAPRGADLRVDPLVDEDTLVAQGAPILRLRHDPQIVFTAPMAGRIASIDLGPGRRLREVKVFREDGPGRFEHAVGAATGSPADLRAVLMASGLWHAFGSRPFGRMPGSDEAPSAIFVTAIDTRPLAPDPRLALADLDEALERGLDALLRLTEGPVFLCQEIGRNVLSRAPASDRLRIVKTPPVHPLGLPGFLIHQHHPARIEAPVWDIHAEDVAAIGGLLATGLVPDTRLVSVAGPAMTSARLVRCQPGAALRALCYAHARPGPNQTLAGSALEGRRARWLGPRDRQVTVLGPDSGDRRDHWLFSALKRASRPLPTIPTAAVDAAFGGALPAIPFLRALASGDRETAIGLGTLSLVDEDLALADYVTAAEPRHSALLTGLLGEIATEAGA